MHFEAVAAGDRVYMINGHKTYISYIL
jgi:alkylation response protein AidB-like acyl-CoA dehydrogenase